MRRLIFIFLLFSLVANSSTPLNLPAFRAVYDLRMHSMTLGETIFTLTHEAENRLVYTHFTHPTGILAGIDRSRKERSVLMLDKDNARPLEFQGRNSLRSKPREGVLSFDWSTGVVSGTWNGQAWQTNQEGMLHDPLSYQLAIMLDLAKGKQTMEYLVAEDAQIKPYHFRVTGNEKRQTTVGEFDTLRVERNQNSAKRQTTLWCAPALSYLPVQVEQQDSGTTYLMVLRTIEGLPPP